METPGPVSAGVGILSEAARRAVAPMREGWSKVIRFLIRTAITALGLLLVAYLGLIQIKDFAPGAPITQDAFLTACLFALVLGLVNAIIKPIVQVLAFPITILTLGLFALVVNIGMFYLAAWIVPAVTPNASFLLTGLAALIVSLVSGLAGSVTKRSH
jgi:putative membrane protein